MPKKGYTEEQIIVALNQNETGTRVRFACNYRRPCPAPSLATESQLSGRSAVQNCSQQRLSVEFTERASSPCIKVRKILIAKI